MNGSPVCGLKGICGGNVVGLGNSPIPGGGGLKVDPPNTILGELSVNCGGGADAAAAEKDNMLNSRTADS